MGNVSPQINGGNEMLSQTFKINTMEDYLAYFVNKVNEPIFSTSLPIVKERILEICRELEEEIDGINKRKFFFSAGRPSIAWNLKYGFC